MAPGMGQLMSKQPPLGRDQGNSVQPAGLDSHRLSGPLGVTSQSFRGTSWLPSSSGPELVSTCQGSGAAARSSFPVVLQLATLCSVSLSSIPVQRQPEEAEKPQHPQLLLLLLPWLQCGGSAGQQPRRSSAAGGGERRASEGQCRRGTSAAARLSRPWRASLVRIRDSMCAAIYLKIWNYQKSHLFGYRICQSFPFSNWRTYLMRVIRVTSHFCNILSWEVCMKERVKEPGADKEMERPEENRDLGKSQ